jgi:diaminopimelate decarboxylase
MVGGYLADDLADRFGTPVLVLLPEQIRSNVREITGAFERYLPRVRSYFALKSCYLRPAVEAVLEAGAGLEVMSPLELYMAEQLAVRGADLLVNGYGHSRDFADRAVAGAPAMFTLDSFEDIATVSAAARRSGTTVAVGLRLSLPASGPGTTDPDTKLGFTWHDGQFERALAVVAADPALTVTGLLAHQLSHCAAPDVFGRHLAGVVACMRRVQERTGIRFPVLDVGGGFESRLLLAAQGVSIGDFAAEAGKALDGLPYPVTVYLEPGRFVAADAVVGLTTVVATKERPGGDWLITDLGTNALVPVPGSRFPAVALQTADGAGHARLSDRSCAPAVIDPAASLPRGVRRLAILNAGAYTTALSHVWGPELPRVVSVDRGRASTLVDADSHRRAHAALYRYGPVPEPRREPSLPALDTQ